MKGNFMDIRTAISQPCFLKYHSQIWRRYSTNVFDKTRISVYIVKLAEVSHSTYSLTSKHLRQNRTNHSNQGSIPGDERSQRNGWVSVNKRQTHRSEGLNQGRSWQPSGKSLLENCRGTLPSQWRTGDREHKKERRQILCQDSEPEVDVKCVTQSN